MNCKRFEGKVVIVTAATAGIGLGIVRRLASEGAKVMVSSRRQQNVDETVLQLKQEGLTVAGCVCHVGNPEHIKRLIEATCEAFGERIDVLVSNAAVNPAAGPILEMPDAAIDKILDINIKSAILLTRAVLPHMQRGGNVIFVSSFTAFNPSAPLGMYAVSKTALVGLTKALAGELGPQGIRVNCIAPGFVPTHFSQALFESSDAKEANEAMTALGRLGTPQDMAAAVAYLASEDASYVTAETLVIAGGMQSRL